MNMLCSRRTWFDIPTIGALYFAVACGAWIAFKQAEPTLFPVITKFTVTEQVIFSDKLVIAGTFNKNRACEIISVMAYDNIRFINVDLQHARFKDTTPLVNRIIGEQTFSGLTLSPLSKNPTMYATHQCTTGLVVTKLISLHLD